MHWFSERWDTVKTRESFRGRSVVVLLCEGSSHPTWMKLKADTYEWIWGGLGILTPTPALSPLTLTARPGSFSNYIAPIPSLWPLLNEPH